MNPEKSTPHGVFNDFEFTPVGWWLDTLAEEIAKELGKAPRIGRGSVVLEQNENETIVSFRQNGSESIVSILEIDGRIVLKVHPEAEILTPDHADDIAHELVHQLGYAEHHPGPSKSCC